MTGITEHLDRLRTRIAQAAVASGRSPGDITLLAVSKGHPVESVHSAQFLGIGHFGENYAQEAVAKIDAAGPGCCWHFIGRLQANKARLVAGRFDWVQSVTTPRLAERLAAHRPFYGEPLQVCIQLQAPGATERGGCAPADMPALAATIAGLPRLRLRGLMLVPRPGLTAAGLHAEYRELGKKLGELRTAGHEVDTLSMGMSDDFEIAIAAGSTMVRIGTALFGPRPRPQPA